jgi:hypothetical protein
MSAAAPENMVLRTVYLPKALDNQLRDKAFGLSMSKGEFIRVLIQEALDRRASPEPVPVAKAEAASQTRQKAREGVLQPAV